PIFFQRDYGYLTRKTRGFRVPISSREQTIIASIFGASSSKIDIIKFSPSHPLFIHICDTVGHQIRYRNFQGIVSAQGVYWYFEFVWRIQQRTDMLIIQIDGGALVHIV